MKALIDYTCLLFPSIDPDVAAEAKRAVQQFNFNGKESKKFLLVEEFKELSQGDVINELPFYMTDKEGNLMQYFAPGMLLSTSCDVENKDYLTFAPLFNISEHQRQLGEIKKNTINHILYIPDEELCNKAIDFRSLISLSRNFLE